MALKPGQFVFVKYQGFGIWHERLVLGAAANSNSRYAIRTPDGDQYFEEFNATNLDIDGFKRATGDAVPVGIPPGTAYRFRVRPTRDEITRYIAEAREMIVAQMDRDFNVERGDGDKVWMVLESRGGLMIGEIIELSSEAVIAGDRAIHSTFENGALVYVSVGRVDKNLTGVVDDARTLPIRKMGEKRYRDFKSAVDLMSEVPFPDWPITGPRTMEWCLRFLQKRGGPLAHHEWWMSTTRLSLSDPGTGEHENAMRAIEDAICYDQCDIKNHAGYEHVIRKAQLWEHYYKEKMRIELASSKEKTIIDLEEQSLFMGTAGTEGSLMVCPSLTDWVAREMEKIANIDKQTRKAREERALRRK